MSERQKQHMGRSVDDEREIRGRDVAADETKTNDAARATGGAGERGPVDGAAPGGVQPGDGSAAARDEGARDEGARDEERSR